MKSKPLSILTLLGFLSAVVAAVGGALAGPAYRWDMLALGEAFAVLRWSAYGGLAAVAVSLLGLIHVRPGAARKGTTIALLGFALGAATFWLPYSQQQQARRLPPIHDITTDTINPPQFEAVVPLRPDGANSLKYGGETVARQQRRAYPDIRPAVFDASYTEVFKAALATAVDMGWRIVAGNRDEGHIEAVATTFWFGFEDDVVVRIETTDGRTRIDVRSVSRVGVSDVGKNARRIRAFVQTLEENVQR